MTVRIRFSRAVIYANTSYCFSPSGLRYVRSSLLLSTDYALIACSGMVYEDAEKLYAEVRADTEALTEDALRVIYPGSCPLSSASSGPQTLFAHNTTPFARRDIVRVPLSSGVLQMTSDGKEGYVVMEGGLGGGLVLPSQISAQELKGARRVLFGIYVDNLGCRRHGGKRECGTLCVEERECAAYCIWWTNYEPFRRPATVSFCLSCGKSAGILLIRDCSRRELIPHGETGGLVIFDDIPNYWDAWGALRLSLHV